MEKNVDGALAHVGGIFGGNGDGNKTWSGALGMHMLSPALMLTH